jgi:hypothetical protein
LPSRESCFSQDGAASDASVGRTNVLGGTPKTAGETPALPITKRERGTLVFAKHEGSWKIVYEHCLAAE